jgi:hypothetical protein
MWQVTCSGLCIRGALGKGTLRRYPSFRVPTDHQRARSSRSLLLMCHAWTHLCQLSQVEVKGAFEQGGAHGRLVSIHCQHEKPIKTVQDQERTCPWSWGYHEPASWNWYLELWCNKESSEEANKKGVQKCNINWQGSRHNDVEAVNQAFGTNEGEIKQRSLEAIRLLRQADSVLTKICNYIEDCTA